MLVADIQGAQVAVDREGTIDSWVLTPVRWLVEIVDVLHVTTAQAWQWDEK